MRKRYYFLLLCMLGLFVPALSCQTPDAETELSLGIAAYENAAYADAISHLERSVSLDPNAVAGHYHLALAYNAMCSEETCEPRWSERAIEEYRKTLDLEPTNSEALKSLAYLLFSLARREEAERYYRKAAALDPNDAEAAYGIAVIDFWRTYRLIVETKHELHLPLKRRFIDQSACQRIRGETLLKINEGIELLEKSSTLRDNVDASSYLATLYVVRAEIECGNRSAYESDRKTASELWEATCKMSHEGKPQSIPRRWFPGPPPPPPKPGDTCVF